MGRYDYANKEKMDMTFYIYNNSLSNTSIASDGLKCKLGA